MLNKHLRIKIKPCISFNPLSGFGETSVKLYNKTCINVKNTNPNKLLKALSEWESALKRFARSTGNINKFWNMWRRLYCTRAVTFLFRQTRPIVISWKAICIHYVWRTSLPNSLTVRLCCILVYNCLFTTVCNIVVSSHL